MLRLAEHLGKTRSELLATTSSREIEEWRAWERMHGPLGAERHDYLAGAVRQAIFEVNRSQKKRKRPYTTAECLPFKIPGAPESGGPKITSAQGLFEWAKTMAAAQRAQRK